MPPVKDVKRLTQKPRSKSTDNTRIVELRKERSRDAARTRRGKENAQFDELAKLLPLPNAIASQLDKASIVRLTISYLDMKQFVRIARRERQTSDTSIFSESSTSPMSECGTDGATGSPGSCSPNSSISSPPVSTGAVVPYQQADPVNPADFAAESGLYLLQALDGFLFVISNEGKVLYVSETVSVHLGLSQVELTGSNIYSYLHPEDQDDLTKVLDEAMQEIENASNSTTSGLFDNNIPFFGQQQPFARGHTSPSQERPKSFFLRMKCTLVRRGGAYTKSSGFKVIHCMGRIKKYSSTDLTPAKYAFVAMGQPLPTMNINELPLECDMFVSRVNMDLTIVYCEGRIHRFMDYFARDIVGISAYDFYHGSDIAVIQSHHAKFLSKGQVLTKYYRWMNKNGGWVWMQTKASLIPHPTNPELKQMLCLNYILSDVEHRGVVLGMAQLEDKPDLNRSGAYITEVENESDSSGNSFKDARYDAEVMVYPKWLQTADKLVPKPTLLDTLALSRTGYGLDTSVLENDVFATTSSPLQQTSTSLTTTASSATRTTELATASGSTSTLEDDLDDIAEIIDADMTDLDREFISYVLSGTEIPLPTQPAQKSPRVPVDNFAKVTAPPNEHTRTGLRFGEPKLEQIPMEVLENATLLGAPEGTCRVKDPKLSSQTFGGLPPQSLCSDTKKDVLPMHQEGELLQLTFTTESSKLRGTSGACMYSNTSLNSGGSETTSINNTNLLKIPSAIPPRSVAYTSHTQSYGSSTLQRSETTSTENFNTARRNNEKRFLQQLKASFVSEKSFSDDILVDLVDEMMQDRAAQRKKDEKLAVCLQQGGHYQMEGMVKQEVVTPTMAQSTSLFSSFFDSLATQGTESQPSATYRSSGQRENGFNTNPMFCVSYTNTIPQFTASQSLPGGKSRRQQGGSAKSQNEYFQFAKQEDSNMNFLNSLSNGNVNTNNLNMSNNFSSNQLPTQQSMQRTIRDILQTTNNTAVKQTISRSPQVIANFPSQQNLCVMPQQNVTAVSQTAPMRNQRGVFNTMTMNPMMNQFEFQEIDSVIQSLQQEEPSYRSPNGADMPSINNQTFDFSRTL